MVNNKKNIIGGKMTIQEIMSKIKDIKGEYVNGMINSEELVEHLKNKFPEEYKLSLEDLKNDGSDDPEMEMTPGRFVDHIGDKGDDFLKEYEAILKKLSE